MADRKDPFQLLNETQRNYLLGKLKKSKKFRNSPLYHTNPSKVKKDVEKTIDNFNKNFLNFSSDFNLLKQKWRNSHQTSEMYNVLADFYLGSILFDLDFRETFEKRKMKLFELANQESPAFDKAVIEEIEKQKLYNERNQEAIEELINNTKIKEDLQWLLKNLEYQNIVYRLVVKEGFITNWELEQEGHSKMKVFKIFKVLKKRSIIDNPNEKQWHHIQNKYILPFQSKKHISGKAPLITQNKVWVTTSYGRNFTLILQSNRLQDLILNKP